MYVYLWMVHDVLASTKGKIKYIITQSDKDMRKYIVPTLYVSQTLKSNYHRECCALSLLLPLRFQLLLQIAKTYCVELCNCVHRDCRYFDKLAGIISVRYKIEVIVWVANKSDCANNEMRLYR